MSAVRWSVSLVAVIGLIAVTLAASTIWLMVSDPVTTADAARAASKGDVAPLVQALGAVLVGALRGIFKYL
jgi:multidrug resistance efflux pump